jgi:hypothetical protein
MDPISAGIAVVGLGLSIFGGMSQANVSRQQAQVSAGIAADEQQINVQKQQQMQLEARRSQLENFRNAQRQRANATASAVNQGAQFGTGLQGGIAGVQDTALENSLGINQGMQISQNIFGINSDISNKKIQLAQLGGTAATDQGLASLGGSLMKSAPIIGGFGKDLTAGAGSFGSSVFQALGGGGGMFFNG